MPSGNTHNKINFLFLPVFLLFLVGLGFGSFKYVFFFSLGFVFGTLFLDPDLDTRGKSYSRWGFFKFIWIPYQRTFPHRSVFTHGLIIGDVIRILYLIIWLMLLFWVPTIVLQVISDILNLNEAWTIVVICTLLVICFRVILKLKRRKKSNSTLPLFLLFVIFLDSTNIFSIYDWLIRNYNKDSFLYYFVFLGVVLSSTLHIVCDILVSTIKKVFK